MSEPFFIASLSNGLTVVGEPQSRAQTVSFSLQLPLGSARDPLDLRGLAGLTQDLLFKGAGPWDAPALATEIDRIGFQESHRVEREFAVFSGTVLPPHLAAALELTRTLLQEPHLPPDSLEEVRQLMRHHLLALDDAPSSKMFYELGQRFFPAPLSNPVGGTLETLSRIQAKDVRRCWRHYSPRGAVLAVAGAVSKGGVLEQVERAWGHWQGEAASPLALAPAPRALEHLPQESEQVQIGLGYDSVPYGHPDYLKARVGVLALSGGMSSRLALEVRQVRGLAYSVFATHVTTKDFGGVIVYAGTSAERAQETLEVLLAELHRLGAGLAEEELANAKTRLKTDLIVQGESTRARAEALARELCYVGQLKSLDETLQEIDALSLQEVNAYLRRAAPRGVLVLTLGPRPLHWPAGA